MEVSNALYLNEDFQAGFDRGFDAPQKEEFQNGHNKGFDKGLVLGEKITEKAQKKEFAVNMILANEPDEKIELYTELPEDEIGKLREALNNYHKQS